MAFGSAKSKQELANELKTFKSVPKSALHTVQCNISKKRPPHFYIFAREFFDYNY